jgi:hypothetical protein
VEERSPESQLADFIAKFTPEIAAQARVALEKMRARLPGALELVYDNYNALAIGFGPTDRASDVIFSIALYPRWVSLFFLKGAALPDPNKLLKGSGKVVRHIVLKDSETFEAPDVQTLISRALEAARTPLDHTVPSRIVIKSVSAKQRPRRPR